MCQVGQARCYRPEQETEREKLRQDLLLSWRKQNSQKSQPISETQTSGELSESSQTGSTSQEAGSRDAFCVGAATHGGADQPSDSAMWVDSFSARLPTEAVRNGTRIHRDVQHHIVHTVAMALLDRGVKDGSAWNSGGWSCFVKEFGSHSKKGREGGKYGIKGKVEREEGERGGRERRIQRERGKKGEREPGREGRRERGKTGKREWCG